MPTRGSHRPVRARIRAYGSSNHGFAACLSRTRSRRNFRKWPVVSPTLLSAPVSWTRLSNFDAFVVFLKNGSMIRRLASLHRLQQGAVRQLQRYYQVAMTSCHPSRRTSLPSFGGTSALTRSVRSPADECAAEAWSWSPGVSSRDFTEETTGPRKFLGNPDCPFAHVQSTPAGLLAPDHKVPQHGPRYVKSEGSHERSFDAQ